MSRITRYAIVALLALSVSVFPMDIHDAHKYILLIADVHSYYGTTCIIIVRSDSYTDPNQTALTYIWSRAFSQRGIFTMIVSFSELSREARKFQGYITRPLYVVILATKETVDEFSMATGQIDISFPVWLVMFLPYRGNLTRNLCENPLGNPFNLMFDTEMLVLCYDQPILREWYSLRDNRTRFYDLASWESGQGLNLRSRDCLYVRRNNMFGETMRVSFIEDSPFVEMKNGVLSHFFGEVIIELSKSINFRIELTSSISAYGSWNKEEKVWTGLIGEVVSKRADFGVAEFSMTNHRLDVVDFTLPLIISPNKIYFKKPDGSSVQWSAYFKTFRTDIWVVIICLIVSTPIFLTVMKTKGRIVMRILSDHYISVWGIYCQQGLSEFPSQSSMRLAFLSIFLSALIILSAYSASLISFLTVSTVTLPFTTMEEFANYGSYKLIVFKNSADYDMIISANTSLFSKVKKLLKRKEDLPLTIHDGFAQVCTEKVGFYLTEAIKDGISGLPCETAHIEADKIDSLALVLNKDSPYTGLVNYHLQRFKDNGMLVRLRNTFLVTKDSRDKGYTSVTLRGIAPILAVLAGGVLFSCFLLMLEKVYHNLWSSERKETFRFDFSRKSSDRDNNRERRAGNFVKDTLPFKENYRSKIIFNESLYNQKFGSRI
ncbi:PREDICTED: glutamate receptor ionotropic, delta-2-like [Eufriesea mexicana]|uniref:glutamate receptor ionotropic, delta-2-like n=1 Tax=Eufriesea mexicana TaxID=516756 RepID=UPI00083C24D3|nr:PREDICTED: glutamate receptor ionotropic, delta-2-like [Eufriesea mexicana]